MATSLAFLSAFMAFSAAPDPRPPQPIRPILITSLPAACALRASDKLPTTPAEMAAADVPRNCRRDAIALCLLDSDMFLSFPNRNGNLS